jgi:hypothetical protein
MSSRSRLPVGLHTAAAVLVPGLLLSGCAGGQGDAAAANTGPSVRPVEVEGSEYEYEGIPPEAFPATYEIAFDNAGEEVHELSFVRLKAGTTARSVIDAQEAGEDPATLVEEFLGTTGPVEPGGSGALTVVLEDGASYGYACLIEAPDGAPHALHGMLGELSVSTSVD